MWLFVPNTSTSSPSAPVEPASILASNWQFQMLEQCAWSRGKVSRSRNWYQLWKRASWLRRLYGAMPEPSMAAHGVAQWTASLVASRASRTALPESVSATKTSATSGQLPAGSSSNPRRGSSSSKTSGACSRRVGLNASGETFTDWASGLREDCSRRRKSAQAMSANASSSLLWPTATPSRGGDNTNSKAVKDRGHGNNLVGIATAHQASAWPTPTANDWKGSGPTMERSDGKMRGDRLDYATEQLWSTPRASDGEKGGPNQSFGAGGIPLPAQTVQWMTPRSHEVGNYQYSRGDKTKPVLTLTGQASSLPVLMTVKTGKPHSKDRRSLNPLFVEWLMGWPPGWTLLAWTDFACSETELSAWKRRMRCALLQLGLPPEAPPAQLALFG